MNFFDTVRNLHESADASQIECAIPDSVTEDSTDLSKHGKLLVESPPELGKHFSSAAHGWTRLSQTQGSGPGAKAFHKDGVTLHKNALVVHAFLHGIAKDPKAAKWHKQQAEIHREMVRHHKKHLGQ
jgi:hypothetical protein